MSEPVQLAKAAREQLAAALNALQTDDNVPDELLEAAEPIAQAMSVLHRIERTNGADLEGRDGALVAVRTALERLQKVSSTHAAVEIVMEAVAKSLSKVHALARYTPPAAAPASPPVRVAKPIPVTQPVPVMQAPAQPVPVQTVPVVQPAPQQPIAQPQPAPFAESAAFPLTQQPRGLGTATMPSTVAPQPAPQYAAPQFAPPAPQQYAPAPQQYAPAPQQYAPAPAAPAPAPAAPAPAPAAPAPAPAARVIPADRPSQPRGAMPGVEVELGIHSVANFYKGLGGNDVIEHGGIFVATYKVLKIGTPVSLRILLPGDYEFQASGAVQWTREGGSAEPGYGVRFTQISAEGRQLVYRYTRNREPMFYDDL